MAAASYDRVVSLEGLEHLDKADGAAFIGEVHRVLAPGGLFLLSCPVSNQGRHSGNNYHHHEWSWGDLRTMLSVGFDIEDARTDDSIGDAIWCRLRRVDRSVSPNQFVAHVRSMGTSQLADAFAAQQQWLDRAFGLRAECGLWSGGHASLLPTCFAVLAAECCGLSLANRADAVARRIKERQAAADGSFDPGDIGRRELTSHSATYLRLQSTYFAVHALNALSTRPDHRIRMVERLQDVRYLRGWLDGGPWQNPWLHSNTIMFALTFLQTDAEWYSDEESARAFDAILDYLDERQDPQSGLWQPDDGPDMKNAVYAAYHFFPYYFWRGRRPKHIDRIIDSTLSIQQPGGLFGGGACEDLDAVHTLVMMSLISTHRAADVRATLERAFWRLLQLQNEDGGFSNYVRPPVPPKSIKRRFAERTGLVRLLPKRYHIHTIERTWRYSGWKQLECPSPASDSWGAWFRPLALKLVADRYPEFAGPAPSGKYRALPGLGWHDVMSVVASTPRS
jgi:hypothetical protein